MGPSPAPGARHLPRCAACSAYCGPTTSGRAWHRCPASARSANCSTRPGQPAFEVAYTLTGTPRELPEGAELAAYRVVQESLTNTRKHAGLAATAAVALRYEPDGLTVDVTDNGLGIAGSEGPGGHGLAGMRERIALYGGTVEAGPLPGGGFGVTARLPCPGRIADPDAYSGNQDRNVAPVSWSSPPALSGGGG